MMLKNIIDTHSHIYSSEFDKDVDSVIEEARNSGVTEILMPAVDSESHARLFELAHIYKECIPMMGLHPTSINDNPKWREELELVEKHLQNPPVERFCAVGEIGLDFYWSCDFKSEQFEAFHRQIEMALNYNLPVVVHCRDAWGDVIEVLEKYKDRGLKGVLHAYSGDIEAYLRLRGCGDFLFGIGGVVTFKNSKLSDVVAQIPLSEIVIETDAPYLTPAPYRGKRNEPKFTIYICDKIAELKGITSEEVAKQTTINAQRMFGLSKW